MGDLTLVGKDQWETIKQIATQAFKSGILPQSIKTPEMAAIVALKGHELGIPPMQALSGLYIVNNKVGMSAELMLALIWQRCPTAKIHVLERTPKGCKIKASRNGGDPEIFEFNEADAKRAGLTSAVWTKYPANMMFARTVSNMGRQMFPDILSGVSYTPDEIDEIVSSEGGAMDVSQPLEDAPVEEPKSKLTDEKKTELIKRYLTSFSKLHVSQADIERKFGVDSVFKLTEDQVVQLRGFGVDISKNGVDAGEIFAPDEEF